MINNDRIVSVTATDLLTLYGLILLQDSNNSSLEKLSAAEVGEFQITANSKLYIADEPVKSIDIDATASSVTATSVYFVPAYDYAGFTIDGAAVTPTGDVVADGRTLYKAVLATGAITITKIGF